MRSFLRRDGACKAVFVGCFRQSPHSTCSIKWARLLRMRCEGPQSCGGFSVPPHLARPGPCAPRPHGRWHAPGRPPSGPLLTPTRPCRRPPRAEGALLPGRRRLAGDVPAMVGAHTRGCLSRPGRPLPVAPERYCASSFVRGAPHALLLFLALPSRTASRPPNSTSGRRLHLPLRWPRDRAPAQVAGLLFLRGCPISKKS